MKRLEYYAAYFLDDSGWYVAELLDFPGVITQGRTLNSARRMLRDALREMAAWLIEDGDPLPKPNPRAQSKKAAFTETLRLSLRVEQGATA